MGMENKTKTMEMTEIEKKDFLIYELEETVRFLKITCIELGKRAVYTEKEKDEFYEFECKCGMKGLSLLATGGSQIADTGDYGESYCPCCGEIVD